MDLMIKNKQFQRKIEDFTCNNCGFFVMGTGYTNHCPHCLYSRHVDINPGDRAAKCGGMMKPAGVIKNGNNYDIIHVCVKCGKTLKNKVDEFDNFDILIEISKHPSDSV